MGTRERPPDPLTQRNLDEFARSFPLVEGRPDVTPRPSTNPNHHGQPIPAEHEPPFNPEEDDNA